MISEGIYNNCNMEKVAIYTQKQGLYRFIFFLKKFVRKFFLTIFKFLDHPHHSENGKQDFDNKEDFLFVPEIFSIKRHISGNNISPSIC